MPDAEKARGTAAGRPGIPSETVLRWPGRNRVATEISVLIPCWHAEDTIAGALDSIEAQEDLPAEVGVEVVVVIDGRREDHLAVHRWIEARTTTRRWPIILIALETNGGVGAARLAGYRHCSGVFLAFLDDDDLWHPQKLAIQWRWHQAKPERIASSHGYGVDLDEQEATFLRLLIGGLWLHISTLMIRRSLWPYQPEPCRFSEDWLMLAMIGSLQPITVLPFHLAWRSPAAPAPVADPYSLTRQRLRLRAGQIRAILILGRRGRLHRFWIPMLIGWNLLLAVRRWLLDLSQVKCATDE